MFPERFILLISLSFSTLKGSFTQTPINRVSYQSRPEEELPCNFASSDRSVTWRDITGATEIIYEYFPASDQSPVKQSSSPKYENFGITFVQGSSANLIINNVSTMDEGDYQCARSLSTSSGGGTDTEEYSLTVEVPVTPVISEGSTIINDPLEVTLGDSYELTCAAEGAKSVNTLELKFSFEADGSGTISVSNPDPSLMDYTKTVTYTPGDKRLTSLGCTILGYNQVTEDENDVTYSLELVVQFKPECTLIATPDSDDCTRVTLSCDCTSEPAEIDDGDYQFYEDGTAIHGTSGNTIIRNVELNQPTDYTCRARNTLGYGEQTPLEEPYRCELDVTVVQTTTLSSTGSGPTDPAGSSTGWIVAVVFEFFALIITLILVMWLCWERKNNTAKRNIAQRSDVLSNVRGDAVNPGYMDLQERSTLKQQENQLREIPTQNVKLGSAQPGKGLVVYQKATMIRNSRNQDIVVKSLSGSATVDLARHWSSEVEAVMKIQQHNNIVQFIGWCNAVPNLLLTELINGGNLRHYVLENFSPHQLHQYGNTERKKFQVRERGNPENLTKFALDVARGLRFLLDHKFIHPGLRAQKVLLDSAGRCKLYDFVTIKRAKEVTSLLWTEFVPYQWMSPEYLLLGTISSAGDIWSLGVLLWEIYSFGSQPYQDESRTDVENSVRKAERLSMPTNCPGAVWQLMIQCWEQSGETRPKLPEIISKLSVMCNDDKEYDEIPNSAPMV